MITPGLQPVEIEINREGQIRDRAVDMEQRRNRVPIQDLDMVLLGIDKRFQVVEMKGVVDRVSVTDDDRKKENRDRDAVKGEADRLQCRKFVPFQAEGLQTVTDRPLVQLKEPGQLFVGMRPVFVLQDSFLFRGQFQYGTFFNGLLSSFSRYRRLPSAAPSIE